MWKRFRSDGQVEEPFMDVAKALTGTRIATTPVNSYTTQTRQDLIDMKTDLENKKMRGELPSDLDIDAEIERMEKENIQLDTISDNGSNSDNNTDDRDNKSKSWKNRLAEDNNSDEN